MSIVFLIIGLITLAGLVWLATQPADYEVIRSRVINVSPDKVHSKPMVERYVSDVREHQGLDIKTTIDIPLKS